MDKMVALLGTGPLEKTTPVYLWVSYHCIFYWQCTDTIHDKSALGGLWSTGKAQLCGLNL